MKKNKNKYLYITIITVLAVGGFFLLQGGGDRGNLTASVAGVSRVELYKDPNCGCCNLYVAYLKRKGFDVSVTNTSDMDEIKERYGIPYDMSSCHTAIIDNYVVEGHIPVEAITRLLTEMPDVVGITLPGMRSGSPGLPGTKRGPFLVRPLLVGGQVRTFGNF